MAISGALAPLYAVTVSASSASPTPEDAVKKAHHRGKDGFVNPWESVILVLMNFLFRLWLTTYFPFLGLGLVSTGP
jgi:hypothetical protein